MLASMGIQRFHLVDPGLIEDVNVGPQQWRPEDIGKDKAETLAWELKTLLTSDWMLPYQCGIAEAPEEVWASDIFICVIDDMDQRRYCFDQWQSKRDPKTTSSGLFVDGRMSIWTGRVLSCWDSSPESMVAYEQSLFPQSDADPTPCTARATVFGANIIASLMVRQCLQWLRQESVEEDYSISLLSLEVSVASAN